MWMTTTRSFVVVIKTQFCLASSSQTASEMKPGANESASFTESSPSLSWQETRLCAPTGKLVAHLGPSAPTSHDEQELVARRNVTHPSGCFRKTAPV